MNSLNRLTVCSFIFLTTLFLSACGGKDGGFFSADPTEVVIRVEASDEINLNATDRPAPVVVRYYELTSDFDFSTTDFFSIYDKEKELFGDKLKLLEEYEVRPNDEMEIEHEVSEGAKYVAIIAAYRNYKRVKWRFSHKLELNEKNKIMVYLDKNGIVFEKKKWWKIF